VGEMEAIMPEAADFPGARCGQVVRVLALVSRWWGSVD
jgi:hypothetical protein